MNSLNLDDSLKPNSLNPGDTVVTLQRISDGPDQLGMAVGLFNANSQFGDCQNVRYFLKSGIAESGTSETPL